MHHHDIPPLVPVVLPPVPLKLLEGLLGVVDVDREVVQSLAVAVVELVDSLNLTFQVLDSLLDLNDGDIEGAMVDSLVFKSSLDCKHLLLELLDANILASKLLPLRPVLVGQTTYSSLKTFSLGALSRDVVGHLRHLLLQGQELLSMTVFMMGQGIAMFIMILSDHLISRGRVRVALTLSSAKAYLFQDVQLLSDTPNNGLGLSPHPTKKTVHEILEMFDLLCLNMTRCSDIRFEMVHL